ncbi:hypothetical protein GUJ93_ZPchr0006g42734 [Zizania palustris]|uniref:Glycosyltransferase 7 n=1 Tax=Zizania palustris TaxID=103762 RepID=A0A8J5SHD6_ZIZPA|nr:hypothetical protein GUJ93_ZPchr0006g42734 [Zizania palustris]
MSFIPPTSCLGVLALPRDVMALLDLEEATGIHECLHRAPKAHRFLHSAAASLQGQLPCRPNRTKPPTIQTQRLAAVSRALVSSHRRRAACASGRVADQHPPARSLEPPISFGFFSVPAPARTALIGWLQMRFLPRIRASVASSCVMMRRVRGICIQRRRKPTMPTRRSRTPSWLRDAALFAAGAAVGAVLLLTLASPISLSSPALAAAGAGHGKVVRMSSAGGGSTFYDDPEVAYTMEPIAGWDENRAEWLRAHPELAGGGERVLMLSGSQPAPCGSPVGDNLLTRLLKNKVDYCRLNGVQLLYNTALLRPSMDRYWAKIPVVRAAMVAHPEAEWVWWVDSDAVLTDMDFSLPLRRYRAHNLVVHGWPHLVYEARSWTSLNAGVFLIRNCQWSLDFMAAWAAMGPDSPDYERWGAVLTSTFKDKVFNESDDQSALVYMLLQDGSRWREKVFLESDYYFEGYWMEISGRLDNMTERYEAMERREVPQLRRRHAEREHAAYAAARGAALAGAGLAEAGVQGWRRPFVTHFTGCQPCSGHRNEHYSRESCDDGMRRALNFADDQVLRPYGFRHAGLLSDDVRPLPFDYPAQRVVADH